MKNKPNVRIIGSGHMFNHGNISFYGENGVEMDGVTITNTETGVAEFGNTEINGKTTIQNSGKLVTGSLKINARLEHWLIRHPWLNMIINNIIGILIGICFNTFK